MSKGLAAVNFFCAGLDLDNSIDFLIAGHHLGATLTACLSIAGLIIGTVLLKDAK